MQKTLQNLTGKVIRSLAFTLNAEAKTRIPFLRASLRTNAIDGISSFISQEIEIISTRYPIAQHIVYKISIDMFIVLKTHIHCIQVIIFLVYLSLIIHHSSNIQSNIRSDLHQYADFMDIMLFKRIERFRKSLESRNLLDFQSLCNIQMHDIHFIVQNSDMNRFLIVFVILIDFNVNYNLKKFKSFICLHCSNYQDQRYKI